VDSDTATQCGRGSGQASVDRDGAGPGRRQVADGLGKAVAAGGVRADRASEVLSTEMPVMISS
jgi:hypothetical protein